jgi:8-amino-7-oxononanoate synthase
VFSTAPPPAMAAGVREALRILTTEPERRAHVLAMVDRFAAGAQQLGLILGAPGAAPARTPIQPLVLGDEARTMAVSKALFERGHWVAGIRPPTVPRGTSRLRITFCATHTADDVDGLLDALAASIRAAA